MKKYISIFLIAYCSATIVSAQSYEEGLLFSQNMYEGTARFQSMGGAFAALGGDFTTLSINPAGVAIYRSSEFVFTPTIAFTGATTDYLSQKTKESKARFGMGNIGWVSSLKIPYSDVFFNVGLGFNKLQNNTQRFSATGRTGETSLPIMLAAGLSNDLVHGDNLESDATTMEWLAWNTYLIDTVGGPSNYLAATSNGGTRPMGDLDQSYYFDQSGYVGEYVFNLGLNFSDQFYFGMTVGLQDIENDVYEEYRETPVNPSDFVETDFRELLYSNYSYTSGTGYNVKFGAIMRPWGGLRAGAYIHTPTWMYLTNEWGARMISDVWNRQYDEEETGFYDYHITSPMKWGVGVAYTFGATALVSVDYEGADYSSITMRGASDATAFRKDNAYLANNARVVTNLRVGAEYRISDIAVRAGYSYYQNPIQDAKDTHIGSVGLGYRSDYFSLDAAYSFIPSKKQGYELFGGYLQAMSTNTFYSKLMVTLGFRF